MAKNENFLFKLLKEAWKAEWGTPAGKINVTFVLILFGLNFMSSTILNGLDIIGAYIASGFNGQKPELLLDQNSNAFLYCCLILMVLCFGYMGWHESRKMKMKSDE